MIIEELQLSVRAYHALKRGRIDTVEQLQRMTDDDLYCIRNIGKLTLSEIRSKVPYIPPEKIALPTMTIADKIRAMSDEELAAYWAAHYDEFCPNKPECGALLDAGQSIPDECCALCALAWLRKPAEEPRIPVWPHDDKQESGLLEED